MPVSITSFQAPVTSFVEISRHTIMETLDPSRFHLFSLDGAHLLIGYKGGLYQIDDPAYALLCGKAVPPREEKAILDELARIERLEGREEEYPPGPERKVRALCLNITGDCNMNCIYCFTRRRKSRKSGSSMMELSTAQKAIDYLLTHALPHAPLQVDFFGGEPLLNFDVIKGAVEYAKTAAPAQNRKISFTVTTNGSLLNKEINAYLDREGFQVIISLDGLPDLHDSQRPFKDGTPSWNEVFRRITGFLEGRRYQNYYIRGTFTPQSLHIEETARFFIEHHLTKFSLEPARGKEEIWSVNESHLPRLYQEYEELARLAASCNKEDRHFDFFHFIIFQDPPLCITRRLYGCGAGVEYLSITPEGEIYPCHQLHDNARFSMGTIFDKDSNSRFRAMHDMFKDSHILNKPECRHCWARYYCSGGCHANNFFINNHIGKPDMLGCSLQKKRLECALWIEAMGKINKKEK